VTCFGVRPLTWPNLTIRPLSHAVALSKPDSFWGQTPDMARSVEGTARAAPSDDLVATVASRLAAL